MQKGFSLIELLVVITITGLLTAIAIPSYRVYQDRAAKARLTKITDKYLLDWQIAQQTGKAIANDSGSGLAGTPIQSVSYGTYPVGGGGQPTGSNYTTFLLRPYNSPGGLPFIAGYVLLINEGIEQNGSYSWNCTVYMPNNPLSYGGTLTREQTRATYFPDCTCLVSGHPATATCP